jgi:hypothetical protein
MSGLLKCAFVDVLGVYGNYFHYGLVISLVGSAFLLFLYLWKKNSLHMDEEAKYIVVQKNEIQEEKDGKQD